MNSTTDEFFESNELPLPERPIFVVGQARGGTTLIRDVLRASPDIGGPFGESRFFYQFHNQYGDLKIDENLDRLLDDLFTTLFFRQTNLDPHMIRAVLKSSERTYKNVFSTIMSEIAKQESGKRWVEKVEHPMYLKTALTLFPKAQIIQITRDVRDLTSSVLKRKQKGGEYSVEQRLEVAINTSLSWQDRIQMGWFYKKKLDQTVFMMLRYEDLILKTDAVLSQLAKFLGVEIDKNMLSYAAKHGKSTLAKPWSSFDEQGQGLITSPIGRYQTFLSRDEIATIEFLAGRTMKACDYSVSGTPMSLASRISVIAKLIRYPGNGYLYVRGLLGHLMRS